MSERSRLQAQRMLPERLATALTRAERELTGRLAAVLALEGRTVDEWRALALLADGTGHPMAELAECVFLPAPTVTRLVDRMVADNLVHRKVDERDRRRVLAYATPRGRRLRRRLERALTASQEQIVADADDAARLLALLDELQARPRPGPAYGVEMSPLS